MAKNSQENEGRAWVDRIFRANKDYQEWEDKYFCRDLEDFYLGHQVKQSQDENGEEPYIVNLCFPSVEIKIPSLLFYRPKIDVDVRTPFEEQAGSNIAERTKLLEDTANTFISDRRVGFQEQALLALRESFYRFGVVEVGYSGNFIDNPNAGKPMLHDDGSEMMDEDGKPVLEPSVKPPTKESVYVRRIPAHQFRVALGSNNRLDWTDWCGYYEWEYLEDVKRNPAYKNTANLKAQGSWKSDYTNPKGRPQRNSDTLDSVDERAKMSNMVKIWKIYDIRTKTKKVYAEGSYKPLQEESFTYLPFAVLKFHDILDTFYPLPPMFNWRLSQKEFNTTRQAQKIHLKRFKRRFARMKGTIDESEFEKLETGPDGVCVETNVDPEKAIVPIQDAQMSPDSWRNIPATKDDFMQITGVGGESRGEASSATATQASIIDTRARIRESFSRYQMSLFLADIISLLLKTIKEHMTLPFMVKRNVDLQASDAVQNAARVAGLWQQIEAEDLGELDYEVSVDMESMSPANEDTDRQQWMAMMSSLTPQTVLMLYTSDVMLRKHLAFFGIRGDKQILEVRKALESQLLVMSGMPPMQAAQAAKGGGMPQPGLPGMPGSLPQVQTTPGAPNGSAGPSVPTPDRINAQIAAQVQQRAPGASVQTLQ